MAKSISRISRKVITLVCFLHVNDEEVFGLCMLDQLVNKDVTNDPYDTYL